MLQNKKIEKLIKEEYEAEYCKVFAVYEPDGVGSYGDCYCAAVDIGTRGMTYKVFVKVVNGVFKIVNKEKWFMG